MQNKIQWLVIVLLAAVVGGLSGLMWGDSGAQASPLPQAADELPRTITVVGEGQASAAADQAQINLGVQVSDPDVKTATDRAAQDMEAVLDALTAEGVAAEDIQTSFFNVFVERPFGPQGPSNEALYQVSNTVQVTIRDMDQVTTILGAAIEAGANNVNSVNFSLRDPAGPRIEARQKAVDDARVTAEELADLHGVAIGQVVSVSEVINQGAYFVSEQASAATGFGGGGAGPISPGDVSVNVQLQVTYAILR